MAAECIEKELGTIRARGRELEGTELIACVAAMVRFKIIVTAHKQLDACFMFPEDYPQQPIIIELKSKVFTDKLLHGITKLMEQEAQKLLGQRQILHLVQYVRKFIIDTPLCVCSDEISAIKRDFLDNDDEIKLKQKTSQVVLRLREGEYYMNAKLTVPDDYPITQVGVEVSDQNFPEVFRIYYVTQAIELARQAVQPPLKKKKPKEPPFEPKPSLRPVCEFLIKHIAHRIPRERCPCCKELCLPATAKNMTNDMSDPKFVERVYCGHLFHHDCLDTYMKLPPFTGGKKCPACGQRIFHEKWKISPQLAEARWAHKEARARELSEVVDFLE